MRTPTAYGWDSAVLWASKDSKWEVQNLCFQPHPPSNPHEIPSQGVWSTELIKYSSGSVNPDFDGRASELDPPLPYPRASSQDNLRGLNVETKGMALGNHVGKNFSGSSENWSSSVAKAQGQNVLFTSRSHLKASSHQRLFGKGVSEVRKDYGSDFQNNISQFCHLRWSGFWVLLRTNSLFRAWNVLPQRIFSAYSDDRIIHLVKETGEMYTLKFSPKFLMQNRKLMTS